MSLKPELNLSTLCVLYVSWTREGDPCLVISISAFLFIYVDTTRVVLCMFECANVYVCVRAYMCVCVWLLQEKYF